MKAIRKSLAVLLCLAILIGFVSIQSSAAQSVWDGTFPAVNGSAKYSGGKGTKTDPYKIATAKDLAQLSVNTQEIKNYSEGKYFEQTADIVLNTQDMFTFDSDGRVTGIAAGKSPKQWKPIGKAIYNPGGSIADRAFTFYGHYRGDHHKISGIYIDTDESYQGFFGMIVEGSVSEVEIEMSYIKGYISVGGIVGYNDEGTLFECGFAGCVSGYNEVGGLVGHSTGSIQNCFNAAAVSATGIHCGGIVGYNSSRDVSDCFNIGNIEGTNYMGGIAGYNCGPLESCYNTGTISGNNYVGGVAGFNQGNVNKTCNTGTVSGYINVSGIAGYLHEGELKNSYNTGTISGNNYVGGIAGYLYEGELKNSYNTGTVSGSGAVGGVVGANFFSTVTDSYNTGSVSGINEVGGVVGVNDSSSTVADSYNSGTVSGTYNFGGLCGSGAATNSYYLDTSVSNPSNTSGTVLTETEMKIEESFVGFDFVNVWAIESSTGYAYPQFIRNLDPALGEASAVWNGTVAEGFASGTGTESDPYLIKTAGQLAYLASSVGSGTTYQGKYLKLESDIVLNDNSVKYWTLNASDWTPIGSGNNSFRGNFDGAGHVVRGIYIDTGKNYQGLFGYVEYGTVENIGVEASYIKGGNYVGGVVGENRSDATVTNSYNSGRVSGNNYVGGVVGYNYDNSTVTASYNSGTVSGSYYVGGVVGYNKYGSTITNSYNSGRVSGSDGVGGVVGYSYSSSLTNSYNTGRVSGSDGVGGVVGFNSSSTISNCYYLNTSVSNPTNSFGVALTDAQMRNSASFGGFDFDTVWMIDSSAAYPYPTLAGLSHVALEIAVTGVSLNMTSLTMSVGETKTLNATVSPADATDKRVTWSSSNTAVATVNENGVVTAISTGTTVITVTTTDGSKTAQCTVTVKEPVIKMKSGAGYKLNTSGSIVYNVKPGTKVSDLLKNFEGGTLEVRDKNGTLLSGDKTFGSGAKLNLIAGGKVVDTLTLAVLGDIDGDGKVLASDARQVLRHAAKLTTLGELEQLSANTDGEAGVKASDARIILRVAAKLQTL